jgi:hypothetical protein
MTMRSPNGRRYRNVCAELNSDAPASPRKHRDYERLRAAGEGAWTQPITPTRHARAPQFVTDTTDFASTGGSARIH